MPQKSPAASFPRPKQKPIPTPHVSSPPAPTALEATLGHIFANPALLTVALTHRSYVSNGTPTDPRLADPSLDNEQLEFVGDAVLGLLAAEALYRRFPASREGELTRLRASIVSRKHLGTVGAQLDLGQWLLLGETAEKASGRTNTALLSNAVEAILAAIYLDAGLGPARHFVELHILTPALPALEQSLLNPSFAGAVGDHKSALQEYLQANGLPHPEYRFIRQSGPDHRLTFHIAVHLGDDSQPLAHAEASSKKIAQQLAAGLALTALKQQESPDV